MNRQTFYGRHNQPATFIAPRDPLKPLHQDRPGAYFARRRWDGGSASTLFKCQKLERLDNA